MQEDLLIESILSTGLYVIPESQKQFNEVVEILENYGLDSFFLDSYHKDILIYIYTDGTFTTLEHNDELLNSFGFCSANDFIQANEKYLSINT